MTSYTIRESLRDGIAYLEISGDLELGAKDALEHQVAEQLRAGTAHGVVIDVSAVSFIDSAGIGALVTCRHLANDHGTSMRIVGAQGQVEQMLNLTNVSGWLAGDTSTP